MTDKMINIQVRITKNGLEDIETTLEVNLNNWQDDLRSEVFFYIHNHKPAYADGIYTILDFKYT